MRLIDGRILAAAEAMAAEFGGGSRLGFKMAAREAATEISLYDVIGGWDGPSAADVVQAIHDSVGPVHFRINSVGGYVYEGLAIYNAALEHPHGVTAQIDGMAASIASIIPMAAKKITMADNARMMVHRAWGGVVGNTAAMTAAAKLLADIDVEMAEIYSARTGWTADEAAAKMRGTDGQDGTYFTAAEALAAKLVDEVTAKRPKKPSGDSRAIDRVTDRLAAKLRVVDAALKVIG